MNPIRRRRLGSEATLVKAAMFNGANNQFLSIADNAALSMGAGVHPTFVGWYYPTSFAATMKTQAKEAGTAATIEYGVQILTSGLVSPRVSDGTTITSVNSSVSINLNQWVFMAWYYDGANLGIAVNNGAFATTALTNDIQNSTNNFRLGLRSDGAVSPYTGALAQHGVVKSILSATELTELWNGGKGKSFAQISPTLAAKFVAYWDLDDAGGSGATWLDKAGANHLTAGTTTAAPTAATLMR